MPSTKSSRTAQTTGTPTGYERLLEILAQWQDSIAKLYDGKLVKTATFKGMVNGSMLLNGVKTEAGSLLHLVQVVPLMKKGATMSQIEGGVRFDWRNGTWLELTRSTT